MARFTGSDRPGCAVGVVRQGELVHAKGYGMASLDDARPIEPETLFDIASNGKQFTAMAIFLLAHEGKLSVDDEVQHHLADFPRFAHPIRLRHLLSHTSGVRDYTRLLHLAGSSFQDRITPADVKAMVWRQKALDFEPGSRFGYSNSGYFVLGMVIERVSGLTYPEFITQRLLAPLGMKASRLSEPSEVVPNRALGYGVGANGQPARELTAWTPGGDGGLLTNVVDLARWDANFYGPRVGDQHLLEQLLAPNHLNDGSEQEFASGLIKSEYRGLPTVLHGGSWPGFGSQLVRFPQQRITVMVLCNTSEADSTDLAFKISDVALEGEFRAPLPATPSVQTTKTPEKQLEAWLGTYRHTESDELVDVARFENTLLIQRWGSARRRLLYVGDARFVLESAPEVASFAFEGAKRARTMTDTIHGKWSEFEPAQLATDVLGAFAGDYTSDELGTTWQLTVEGASIKLEGRNLLGTLEPLSKTAFATRRLSEILDFDWRGSCVSGFSLRGEEPRLRFERTSMGRGCE